MPLPGSPYVTALAYTNALEADASGRLLFVNSSNGSLGLPGRRRWDPHRGVWISGRARNP